MNDLLDEQADHDHKWAISAETFWTTHSGDIRLIWCEVCDERIHFPMALTDSVATLAPCPGYERWLAT